MMEEGKQNRNSFHLAGIVPVAGSTSEFGFEWHGSLIPIAPNYNAIEAAIIECAYAGCETIWVVCNDDIAPLIKYRIGEYVRDIDSLGRGTFIKYSSEAYIDIPIYYVPLHPKHRDKIDCYPWSILHGANVAYWMCRRLSRWLIPDRYYVSFPFGIYDPNTLKKTRSLIRKKEPFYFSYEGKTIRDGVLAGFTFDAQEWRRARDVIKSNSRSYYPPEEGELMPSRKVPPEERHISRRYTMQDVFKRAPLEEKNICALEWFYDLTTWDGYCNLLSSSHCKKLVRPSKLVFPGAGLNKLGEKE